MTINTTATFQVVKDLGTAVLGIALLWAANRLGRAIDAAALDNQRTANYMLISCNGAQPIGIEEA